jgi:hypothetical protein
LLHPLLGDGLGKVQVRLMPGHTLLQRTHNFSHFAWLSANRGWGQPDRVELRNGQAMLPVQCRTRSRIMPALKVW